MDHYEKEKHPRNGKYIKYGRVSTGSNEQHNSLMVQTSDDEKFSFYEGFEEKYNYSCYAVYSDEASGTSDNRKGYQEMLYFLGVERRVVPNERALPTGNIEKEKSYYYYINKDTISHVRDDLGINYIFCKNTARWTRAADFALIHKLRENGIYIYFKEENIDTFEREKDATLGIIQTLDRTKSQDTSIKVKSGMEASIRLGKIRTNRTIYGFELKTRTLNEPTKLIKIPDEAKVVELIFKLYVEDGLGSRQIVNELNKRGIVTRKKTTKKGKVSGGVPFSLSSVKRILANEKYCGCVNIERKWDSGEVFSRKSPSKIHDYNYIPSENIEPIISIDTFNKAREICKIRADKTSPRGRNCGTGIYTGKIICGLCGANYTQNGDLDSKGVYRKRMNCSTKKRFGISVCDNNNVSFPEIDRRYEELAKNFNDFLKGEINHQRKLLLHLLFALFEYYFVDKEKYIKEIKDGIELLKDEYDLMFDERFELGPNSRRILNEKLEEISTKIIAEKKRLDDAYKSCENIRPLINRVLKALLYCDSIDMSKTYSVQEIKKFDIYMVVYPDNNYKFKMDFEDYEQIVSLAPYIITELNLYMDDEKYVYRVNKEKSRKDEDYVETIWEPPTKEYFNKQFKEYYDKYGVKKEFYF